MSDNSRFEIQKGTCILNDFECSYVVTRRPLQLGGGVRLQILEGDVEVGGGVFPFSIAAQCMDWLHYEQENFKILESECLKNALSQLTLVAPCPDAELVAEKRGGARLGSGRKKSLNPRFSHQVRWTDDEWDLVSKHAAEESLSVSEYVRHSVLLRVYSS